MFKEIFSTWLDQGFRLFVGLALVLFFFHKLAGTIFGGEPLTISFFELSGWAFAFLFWIGVVIMAQEIWQIFRKGRNAER